MPQGFLIDGKFSSLIPINLSHDSGFEINISVCRDSVDQFEYLNQEKISGLSLMRFKKSQNQEQKLAEEVDTYDVKAVDHFLLMHYVSSSFNRHVANVGEQILIFNPFDQSIFYQNLFLDEERRFTKKFEYQFSEKIIFTLEIPDGYAIDEFPEAKNYKLISKKLEFDFEVV